MKKLLTIFLSVCFYVSNATTYYFAAAGSDANAGTSSGAPWQTNTKFNATTFAPGDNIYFNKGDVFYGSFIISQSGTSGSPITIGAYGTGANPIITGLTTVSSWTNLGSNIWESTSAVSAKNGCNMVVINGVNTPMGRWPNSGYNTISSPTSTSITDAALTTTWTKGVAVIRSVSESLDTAKILSQSGTTINFTAHVYNPVAGWGYFIEADSLTLDVQNEWYYSPYTKKLRIYSTVSPTNVQIATVDTLLYAVYRNYVTINGVDFKGSNTDAILLGSCNYFKVLNSNITLNGNNGIYGQNFGGTSHSFEVGNCTFNNNNNDAINLQSEFDTAYVHDNLIKNTGTIAGVGAYLAGMSVLGKHTLVIRNEVDTSGYVGINFTGDSVTVQNNFVNYYCYVKDDGGGIYTDAANLDRVIKNNLVVNGIGASAGTNRTTSRAIGIYLDDKSNGDSVMYNSVVSTGYAGIYLHDCSNIVVMYNKVYDAGAAGLYVLNNDATYTTGLKIKYNEILQKTTGTAFSASDERITWLNSGHTQTDLFNFGVIDSNYLSRPIDLTNTMRVTIGGSDVDYTMASFATYSGFDTHSLQSGATVPSTSYLLSEYNGAGNNQTFSLPSNYKNIFGGTYNVQITVPPYSSQNIISNSVANIAYPGLILILLYQ